MTEENAQKEEDRQELPVTQNPDPNDLAQNHSMALANRDASALAIQSPHITSLVQTQNVLKQELAEKDRALANIAELIIHLERATQEAQISGPKLAEKSAELERKNAEIEERVAAYERRIVRARSIHERQCSDNWFEIIGGVIDYLFGDEIHRDESADDAIKRMRGVIDKYKNDIVDTAPIKAELNALQIALSEYHESHQASQKAIVTIEEQKTYEIFTRLTLTEQATRTSFTLAHYAANNGTSLDAMLSSMGVGDLAKPFANGALTREALDAAIDWAQNERGNVEMPPSSLAFKQFINRMVIPNIGSFEAWASMVDDLNATGIAARQPLELLKQKPITFSGEKSSALALLKEQKKAKSEAQELTQTLPDVKIDAIIRSSKPMVIKITDAVGENEKNLEGFERLFTGIEQKIDGLLATANEKEGTRQKLTKIAKAGREKNERLDEQLGQAQFDLDAQKKLLPSDKPKIMRVLGQATKRAADAAIIGAGGGTVAAPGVGTAIGGIGGAVGGFLLGAVEGSVDLLIGGDKGLSKKGEIAVRQELIDYLRSQKVDVEKYGQEIEDIAKQLTDLTKSAEYQVEVGSQIHAIKIRNAYVARSLLRSGMQNTTLLAESCEQNGVESLDVFVGAFKGEIGVALRRFCFGLANSNDMSLIIAESNALSGDRLNSHELVLKDFVENIMKPDIASYLSKASKVDVISQSNLLPYGAPLEWTKGIIRDENDPKLTALVANEFGMAVVGLQDVKHVFDFYLHRHGDKQLYDAKLKDGQMVDQYPSKRVNVYPPEEVERFVDMTKQSMSHGRKTLPQVSDMFLRVCGYEYFLPQAVRTAGTDNIFSENPEAPAAYPMINTTVNKFIEQMSLGPIQKFREVVGERLDNVIAQAFIDYFAALGAMHLDDPKIKPTRKQLREAANTEDYGPVFSAYTRKITKDATERFGLFMEIYREDLEKHFQIFTEADRKLLEEHLAALPDPSKTILTPDIVKPGSHRAKLLAAHEDHTLENLSKKPKTGGQERS